MFGGEPGIYTAALRRPSAIALPAYASSAPSLKRTGKSSDSTSTELYNASVAAEHLFVTFFPMLFFIMSVGNLIIWYIGGYQVIQDSMPGAQLLPDRKVFTLGQFFTFIGYLGQFYGPLQFMSRVADFLSRSLASAERVFEVLDTESDVQDAENPTPLPRSEGS